MREHFALEKKKSASGTALAADFLCGRGHNETEFSAC
jgi:hypothetical protein